MEKIDRKVKWKICENISRIRLKVTFCELSHELQALFKVVHPLHFSGN